MARAPESKRIDRDALIVSVIAFGFGALFAWALIDPPVALTAAPKVVGSATPQPSEWPAWVQAIMSVITLAGAVFIPRWIDAQKRLDGAEQYVIFTKHLLEKAEALKEELGDRYSRRGLHMWGHGAEWSSVADGAKELELSNLPHANYLSTWLQIREMAIRISDYYEASLGSSDPEEPDDDYMLDGYLYRLRNLHNDLIEIDIAVRGNRGYKKVRVEDE
ncbi:hypothetical protein [Xanthomonas prunicola]|uniref:DUF4760 domain-containing protein n=1 Tax=Xanthomonas prunicola TaxID=2053930 RepID=A0A9Q9J2R7_9XANT|nr:hypothetical protein [Xanthomonas prunicola]UXA66037.1 hypothetical protein M0D43_03050 [Xanthomonas prunicola]